MTFLTDHDCRYSLLQIDGVAYKFKKGVNHETNKRFVGYIAQQVESVVPEAVQLIDGTLLKLFRTSVFLMILFLIRYSSCGLRVIDSLLERINETEL